MKKETFWPPGRAVPHPIRKISGSTRSVGTRRARRGFHFFAGAKRGNVRYDASAILTWTNRGWHCTSISQRALWIVLLRGQDTDVRTPTSTDGVRSCTSAPRQRSNSVLFIPFLLHRQGETSSEGILLRLLLPLVGRRDPRRQLLLVKVVEIWQEDRGVQLGSFVFRDVFGPALDMVMSSLGDLRGADGGEDARESRRPCGRGRRARWRCRQLCGSRY